MTRQLIVVDCDARQRQCLTCGSPFSVPYPSDRRRFCGRSCASRSYATRPGGQNANWRGGKTKHPLYKVYTDMLARCRRPSHHAYARYGGRGITVCPRWVDSFWNFVADMGERPPGLSIDRIDNDSPYAPDNCRWANASQQSKNRRPSAYEGRRRDNNGRYAS